MILRPDTQASKSLQYYSTSLHSDAGHCTRYSAIAWYNGAPKPFVTPFNGEKPSPRAKAFTMAALNPQALGYGV